VGDDIVRHFTHSNKGGYGATVFLSKYLLPMPVYFLSLHYLTATENKKTFLEAKSVLEWVAGQHDGVVIVANMGVHFNNRTELIEGLEQFLTFLNFYGRRKYQRNIVLWRETAAQHFGSHGLGYNTHSGEVSVFF
jgi:hypothetical protein